jgi:HEAT repeat protein
MARGLVERTDVAERLRLEALGAFDKERSSAEDVTWMRSYYARADNPRIKARLVSALTRIGGPDVDQWLLTVARNPEEDSETRSYALRRVAQTQPIADLARLYDASAERSVRESLIDALGNRAEAEATDKLIEIVKTGTDPQLRNRAISVLTSKSKKDPRTMRLLMELIDK